MIKTWKFKDGYYAIGKDNEPKQFVSSWEGVKAYCNNNNLLSSPPKKTFLNKPVLNQLDSWECE